MEEVTRFVITASGAPRTVPSGSPSAATFQRESVALGTNGEAHLGAPHSPAPAEAAAVAATPKALVRATYVLAASAVALLLTALGNLASRFL